MFRANPPTPPKPSAIAIRAMIKKVTAVLNIIIFFFGSPEGLLDLCQLTKMGTAPIGITILGEVSEAGF